MIATTVSRLVVAAHGSSVLYLRALVVPVPRDPSRCHLKTCGKQPWFASVGYVHTFVVTNDRVDATAFVFSVVAAELGAH